MSEVKSVKNGKEKSEKKYFLIFLGVLAASFAVGFLCGLISKYLTNTIDMAAETKIQIKKLLAYIVPAVSVLANIIVFLVALFQFLKMNKLAEGWDGDDEKIIGEIEYKLNWPLLLVNIMTICNCVLFAIGIELSDMPELEQGVSEVITGIIIATFLVSYVFEVLITKLVIDLEKKLNPEKKGSVFDLQFSKKWENSCDELQKQISYKAGFAAYQSGSKACMVLWVIALVAQLMFGAGVFPAVCIGIIWLVMLITYSGSCMKSEKY